MKFRKYQKALFFEIRQIPGILTSKFEVIIFATLPSFRKLTSKLISLSCYLKHYLVCNVIMLTNEK